jgi:purine-binding chemotaxis protein CheW
VLMGLIVDAIQEVVSIPEDKLSKIPYINAKIRSEYIRGIADTPEGMKIVLDVLKVLNDGELAAVKQAESSPQAVAAGQTETAGTQP